MRMKSLKHKISSNEVTIGSWITIPHHSIAEIMSIGDFDWLAIDMEHSAIPINKCQELILSIKSKDISPLVRISKNSEVEIKKVMDSGAEGVIVPMVLSEKDAKKAVDLVKYPPVGKRGVGLARAQDYGFGFDNYNIWQKENSIVIAQIEHIDAVNNIEKIIMVDNLDAIIIGPYDLSASLGCPGELDNKNVINAIKFVEDICIKHSFPFGFHVIEPNHEEVNNKIRNGYKFIGFSIDFLFLGRKIKKELDKLNKNE